MMGAHGVVVTTVDSTLDAGIGGKQLGRVVGLVD
jgi:hypothetical protein